MHIKTEGSGAELGRKANNSVCHRSRLHLLDYLLQIRQLAPVRDKASPSDVFLAQNTKYFRDVFVWLALAAFGTS